MLIGLICCGCWGGSPSADGEPQAEADSGAPLDERRADYAKAREAARVWLDGLEVDVFDLNTRGMGGLKKLGEIVAAYHFLWRQAPDDEQRTAILRRVETLVAQTDGEAYHGLMNVAGLMYQNSMSYLRVLHLMQRFGLDTTSYKQQLVKIKPRLDEHLAPRQPWERQAFRHYFESLGLEPTPAANSRYLTVKRPPLAQIRIGEAYTLAHELYVAFDFGLQHEQSDLSKEDMEYLRGVVPLVLRDSMDVGKIDLAGELLSSMTYLGMTGHAIHTRAIDYLLAEQNENGSWGKYEYLRPTVGDYIEQRNYLHTTTVCLGALVEAFEGGFPASPEP